MSEAILKWADGQQTVADVDPTATTVVQQTADGVYHHFRVTDEIDSDGRDVYVEERP